MESSTAKHCVNNALLIPETLSEMQDAHLVMAHNGAAVFYKCIEQDLRNIECYANAPCLAFVLSGKETFTSFDHEQLHISAGEMVFIPQNMYMVTDFVRVDGPLKAILLFFNRKIISEFLRQSSQACFAGDSKIKPYKLEANQNISSFMRSLLEVYQGIDTNAQMLRIKLLELLHLLDTLDDSKRLRNFLAQSNIHNDKRNIKHLMREHSLHNLTVKDFAALSGRSIASFNRDFKRLFGKTPGQWLIEVRLEKAMELIQETRMSVTEISLEIGYDNTSHFIKAFKQKYGFTPKQTLFR